MKKYAVEYFEPTHGQNGRWYKSGVFDHHTTAYARKTKLLYEMRQRGLKTRSDEVRVRAINRPDEAPK